MRDVSNSLGQRIALTCPWWAWNHARIRVATNKALVRHWPAVVQRLLLAGNSNGRPATWDELARCLRRNPRNVRRTASGDYSLTHQMLLGIASVFYVPVSDMLPQFDRWIEDTTAFLCTGQKLARSSLTAFTCYVLRPHRVNGDSLDEAALDEVLSKQAEFSDKIQLRDAILAVAKSLGPILEAIDADLRHKEGEDGKL